MWKVSWLYEKVHDFFGCAAILINSASVVNRKE